MSEPDIPKSRALAAAGRYALALLCVAVALCATLVLEPDALVTPLFFFAIILSAWFGGVGPGLLAALLATLCIDYFFLTPVHTFKFDLSHLPQLLVFFVSAVLVSSWSVVRKRAERLLRQARDEQEAKVQERTADLKQANEKLQAEIAERQRVEETLRQRADLLDLTHDTIFARDMSDVITYWNRGAEELYGWKAEEAIGKVTHDLMHTIFRAPLNEINETLLRTGRWEGELVHTKRDGTQVSVASRWSLQRDGQGRPVAILETNNDISERRRAEEALRESEAQWKAVFENNPTMYFMVDANGTTLSVNAFGAEQLGYTRDELIGRPVLDIFYDTDRDPVRRNVARCFNQLNQSMNWEARKVCKDGKVLWVRETARAVVLQDRPIILVACEDITERKRAQEELAKTEQRLSAVIANAPIILFALDRSGVFTLSEGNGLEALGLKPGEMVGQSISEVYQDAPLVLSNIRRALAGESLTDVIEINHLFFEAHYLPVFDESGQVAGVNGVAVNITERKRAEEALQKTQAELAHVARVTTMGELTSSIAHEVNQPLAAIVTNGNACLRWLSNDPPNVEEAKQSVTRIVKDGHRASEVVGRVRAFFKKATPEKSRVNINSLIEDVISMVQGELRRNRVQVRTELTGDLPLVVSDPIQLQQVLLNLIINAIEAMATVNEPRELVIKSEAYDPGTVLVAVQDSGPGIDQQNAAELFNPFFTTKPAGLGMGLSISRTTIEAYGGRLWATAGNGGGAIFQFTLPTGDESL